MWGATLHDSSLLHQCIYFNPRSPCGERPEDGAGLPAVPGISIHAPRVGSDGGQGCSLLLPTEFQSTLPVWGATIALTQPALGDVISIHAPRVGSDWDIPFFRGAFFISIHAPRVGSDPRTRWRSWCPGLISIHAPRVGSDQWEEMRRALGGFQSPLPVWGATKYFLQRALEKGISIPAPRVGSDPNVCMKLTGQRLFQSPLPVWGATVLPIERGPFIKLFQSPLPVWGATAQIKKGELTTIISIPAPRVGSDYTTFVG